MFLLALAWINEMFWLYVFLFFVLLAALIPLFLGLAQMNLLRRLTTVVIGALNHCDFRVTQLEGCQIENLPFIRQLIQEENYPLLASTFQEFEQDSEKLFHHKWTVDFHHYLDREHLLTPAQFHRLTPDWSYRILATGLLSGAFFLLLSLTLGGVFTRIALPFSLAPALSGTALFFLTYYRADTSRKQLDQSMKRLAETVSLRVPTYSDLAGSAVLIDAFMQYDRKMDQSVRQLSQTVSQLLNQEMVDAVSSSILTGIHAALLPPLQHSHDLLGELANTITQRQEQGMKQLAEEFTQQVSHLLSRRLEVFFRDLDQYLAQLQSTKGELSQALNCLEEYRKQANALDEQIQGHLQVLQNQNQAQEQQAQALVLAQERLAQTSQQLAAYQTGSSNSLASLVTDLGQQVTGFAQSMTSLSKDLQNASRETQQAVHSLFEAQKYNLNEYTKLSQFIGQGSSQIQSQAQKINEHLEGIDQKLNASIQSFAQAVHQGVQSVLEQLDEGVADVTQRLSSSAAEIRDSAEAARLASLDSASVDQTSSSGVHHES